MIQWTDETDREAAEFYPTLSEREIRRRQDITAQQIGIAHRQGNEDALADPAPTGRRVDARDDASSRHKRHLVWYSRTRRSRQTGETT